MMGLLRRIGPRSLYMQLLVVAALALLLAQIVNGYMLFNGMKGRAKLEATTMLSSTYVNRQERAERHGGSFFDPRGERGTRPDGRPKKKLAKRSRRALIMYPAAEKYPAAFQQNIEMSKLAEGFFRQEIARGGEAGSMQAVYISQGPIKGLSGEVQLGMQRSRLFEHLRQNNRRAPHSAMLLSVQQEDGSWIHGAVPIRVASHSSIWAIIIQTILLYMAVLIPLAIVGRRISKPLEDLRGAMTRFTGSGKANSLEPRGPSDVVELISTFNNLQQRIEQLLSEKDVMLGAIGHDLKTPLASLRVRVESVDDDEEREAMVTSIEETTAMLDDMLMLARLGKSGERPQDTDLAALVETVMDDFASQEEVIDFTAPEQKLTAKIQPMLLRRAIQNLVSNALRYGENASVTLAGRGAEGSFEIIVEDSGPGIAPEQIEGMFDSFSRGDVSRNKASGGSGLGLTIARAIARAHGGDVILENRDEGGLRAILSFAAPI